ncbi:hypothetical protein AB4Y63_04200 [Leifsonia sp. YAF41]|uniref:hypothetical protein n=1 Tax=Leifsonia sp. YAF41 TaxID=3233086 RepID=UPI003F952C63
MKRRPDVDVRHVRRPRPHRLDRLPDYNGVPGRTVTNNYAAANGAITADPLTSTVTDPAGTITTTTDLVGRMVRYTDVGES